MTTNDTFEWGEGEVIEPSNTTTTELPKETTPEVVGESTEELNKEDAEIMAKISEELKDFSSPSIDLEDTVPVVQDDTPTKETNQELKDKISAEQSSVDSTEQAEFFQNKAKLMVEEGVFGSLTEEDIKEITTQEQYQELQQKEIENRALATIEAFKGRIGEEGTDFLNFIAAGGTAKDYLSTMSKNIEFRSMPFDSVEDKETLALKHLVSVENKTPEEAKLYLNFLKDNDKFETTVKSWRDAAINKETTAEQNLITGQKTERKNKLIAAQNLQSTYTKLFSERDSIADIALNKTDKKIMANYIAKPVYENDKGEFSSQFDADLSKALQDPEKKAMLAMIVKNNFKLDRFINDKASDKVRSGTELFTKKEIDATVPSKTTASISTQPSMVDILDDL